jgi:RecA-family ATPase
MAQSKRNILSVPQWLNCPFKDAKQYDAILGTPNNALIRPGTKNTIEAPEKAFKTTFLLRLCMGLSAGISVFPELPVVRSSMRVLYLHGELSAREIEERTCSAARGIPPEKLTNFFTGKDLGANLATLAGQNAIKALVNEFNPEILALDPWQSMMAGADENSSQDVSRATKFLDSLLETGLCLFMPMHLGKDRSKGARGSSYIAGWRDTLFSLIPKRHDGKIIHVKVVTQPRWAEAPDPFLLKFSAGTVESEPMPIKAAVGKDKLGMPGDSYIEED